MAAPEVVQIDLVSALEERHLVLERALWQPSAVVGLEYRLGGHGLILRRAVWDHFAHVGLRVLLHDDVNRGREVDVAADMVAVRVGVDQRGHWFVGQLLDLVKDRLAPAGILRVDDDDARSRDEYSYIPNATL